MSYSNTETEFYHMPPKGIGFKQNGSDLSADLFVGEFEKDLSDEDLALWNMIFQEIRPSQASNAAGAWENLADQISDCLAKERKNFLSLLAFDASRQNESEDRLYIKPAFICRTRLNTDEDVLDILLADQDVVFTSSDEAYRVSTINDESKRVWNPLSYNPKRRKEIYYGLSVWGRQSVNKSDIEICIAILDKIYTLASENHQSIPDWFQAQYPNELPVHKWISIFEKMVPEYEITPQNCTVLLQDALPEYARRIDLYSQKWYRPTYIPGFKYQTPAKLLISYKARLRRLKRLKEGYQCKIYPLLKLDQCSAFPISSEKHLSHPKIVDYIRGFFAQIGISLKADPKNILAERVAWAMEQDWIPRVLKPVFLTYMTACCGRGITNGSEYSMPINPTVYDDRIGKPRQRYAQLTLLRHLCDTFSIGQEGRLKNWIQYLYWQGKTILSVDETRFWREQLEENYESLPAIGFQLCCADYMKDCVPLHLEDLLYDSGSKLWNKGYYNFWTVNHAAIQKQSARLAQKHSTIVTEYRQQWRHAKTYFFTGKDWLNKILTEQISIDLNDFSSIPECNGDELKRLILETELQLAVCSKARSILIKLCKQTYHLDPNLFQEFM